MAGKIKRKRRVIKKVEPPVEAAAPVEGDVVKTKKMDGIEVQDALVTS